MPKRNLAWILVIVMIALLMWQLPQIIAVRDSVYKAFGPLVEARSQIHKRFASEVNDDELAAAAVDAGIRAMIDKLHDPHALYMNQGQFLRFQDRTEGLFGGIGVEVWVVGNGLEVLSRVPHSPAAMEKILPGDIITHIDGQPTLGLSLVEAVNIHLNGPPGTDVTLTVFTPGDAGPVTSRTVTMKRTKIDFGVVRGWARSSDGGWHYMLDAESRIGYVRLTKFTSHIDTEMNQVILRLLGKNMQGLILDLRDNTGGLFDKAIAVADRFLDQGLIVSKSGRKTDEMQWFASHAGTYPNFALVVLVNRSTASAAEIVAGALRDHDRAPVVGEQSYGKGSVQEVVPLKHNRGAIKLTTAHYYLPKGECIHRTPGASKTGIWGLSPTHPVPLSKAQEERCRVVRRESSREPVRHEGDDETTSEPSPSDRIATAERLINADPQIEKALALLRETLHLPSTTPSISKVHDTNPSSNTNPSTN